MNKFNVGDLVTAKPKNTYYITTSDSTCKVIGIRENYIEVKVVAHRSITYAIGDTYWVEAKYFILIEPEFEGN